jgi:hypothetical protein
MLTLYIYIYKYNACLVLYSVAVLKTLGVAHLLWICSELILNTDNKTACSELCIYVLSNLWIVAEYRSSLQD